MLLKSRDAKRSTQKSKPSGESYRNLKRQKKGKNHTSVRQNKGKTQVAHLSKQGRVIQYKKPSARKKLAPKGSRSH